MAEDVSFDEPREAVLELVLSSDEEFQGEELSAAARSENRRAWWRDATARFLPGVDGGAVFALAFALLALIPSALIDIWATNRSVAASWKAQSGALSSKGQADPFAELRNLTDLRALAQGTIAVAAVLVAVLVLSRWREDRHTRWSRPAAQAALGLGLIGVVIAVLIHTGTVGGLPTPTELKGSLGSNG
jgi:hypothetical protein